MRKPKQRLHDAKIMLLGTDPAQREKAKEIIRGIVSEADGTSVANDARGILEKQERTREEERDLALEKYSRRWNGVQGLTDPNIVRLLRELKTQPGVAVRLRTNVVRDVRKWIENVLPKIPELLLQEVDTLNSFVGEISQIDAYRVDEIVPLRRSLFQLRYQKLRHRIDGALDRWAIDEAWQLLQQMTPTPDEFTADVLRIQEGIYKVEELRQSVEESLSQLSQKPPTTWLDLRMLVNSLRSSYQYRAPNGLPEEPQRRVKEAIERGTLAATAFLEKQASLAVDLKGLQEFWNNYKEMEFPGIECRFATGDSWFRNGLNAIVNNVGAGVARVDSPEELKAITRRLTEDLEGLPPQAADRIRELSGEINALAANWLAMLAGDEFDAPGQRVGVLPAPDGFVKIAPEYRALLDEINQALTAIKFDHPGDAGVAERVYRNGVQTAERVLARFADHRSALRLKKQAESGILCWRLDEALRHWRIEEFLKHAPDKRVEGVYRNLASNHLALRQLAEWAGHEELQGWHDAAEWWREWREKKKQLPHPEANLPDTLRSAIRLQEERRRDEWYAILERMIGAELTPEQAQEAAESLTHELQSLNLHGFHQTLTRKAAAGRANRYIDAKEFGEAATEIADLDEYNEETMQLRTRLKVEQARTGSVGETADLFFREWQNVVRFIPNAHEILLDAVERAWEIENAEALKSLKMVLDRAITMGVIHPSKTDQLRAWADWLKIEQAIRTDQSPRSVQQLSEYLRRVKANDRFGYKQRLERLGRYWHATGNTVMLAWAYQAFNRFDPSIFPSPRDPVEDLIADGTQIGGRAFDALRSLQYLGDLEGTQRLREEVRKLTAELRSHQTQWKQLNDYLDLLHYQENRRKPAGKFTTAQRLGDSLLQMLDDLHALRNADWRRTETLERFDAVRRTLMSQFDGFALQGKLLEQIERWDLLTRLRFLESRIIEAAEQCNSDEPTEIYDENHFANLKSWIDQLIEVLTKTGAHEWRMWQIASVDYCELVYNKGGILMPKIQPPDLRALARCVDHLMKEELEFKRKIEELAEHKPNVPANGKFDPHRHAEYLERFPKEPPGSRKVYRRFGRFATGGAMQPILHQSRAYLPDWVFQYVDEKTP